MRKRKTRQEQSIRKSKREIKPITGHQGDVGRVIKGKGAKKQEISKLSGRGMRVEFHEKKRTCAEANFGSKRIRKSEIGS